MIAHKPRQHHSFLWKLLHPPERPHAIMKLCNNKLCKPQRDLELQKADSRVGSTTTATTLFALSFVLAAGAISMASANGVNPSGGSVDLINALNESVVIHCWSRETDFGSVAVEAGSNFYWSFHPNIFGHTVYQCSFMWRELKQEFAVWKGNAHSDRSPCCSKGPCSYKICPDGFYNALIVDTDDYGPAESWVYFKPWFANP